MNVQKFIIAVAISLIAYLLCSLITNNWQHFIFNFGSYWVDIQQFYIVIFGVILFYFSSNVSFKFIKKILLFLILFFTILSFNYLKEIENVSLYLFFMILFSIQLIFYMLPLKLTQ